MLTEPYWSFQFNLVRAGEESDGFTFENTLFMFYSSMLSSEPGYEGADLVRLVTAWLNAGLFDTLDALYPGNKTSERGLICSFISSFWRIYD